MNRYEQWAQDFMEGWKNLDADKVLGLMAEDVEYYETPLAPPFVGIKQVTKLWTVVPGNQKDVQYEYEVLMTNENSAVINWQLTRFSVSANEHQSFDGIFYIKLNQDDKLTYFKQWRFLRGEKDADK